MFKWLSKQLDKLINYCKSLAGSNSSNKGNSGIRSETTSFLNNKVKTTVNKATHKAAKTATTFGLDRKSAANLKQTSDDTTSRVMGVLTNKKQATKEGKNFVASSEKAARKVVRGVDSFAAQTAVYGPDDMVRDMANGAKKEFTYLARDAKYALEDGVSTVATKAKKATKATKKATKKATNKTKKVAKGARSLLPGDNKSKTKRKENHKGSGYGGAADNQGERYAATRRKVENAKTHSAKQTSNGETRRAVFGN